MSCESNCGQGYVYRRYYSRAERAEWLKGYAAELDQELAGVKERIQALEAPAE